MKETKKEKKKGEGIRAHVVFNWDVRVYCDEGRGRDECGQCGGCGTNGLA